MKQIRFQLISFILRRNCKIMTNKDQYSVRKPLEVSGKTYHYYSLPGLEQQGHGNISALPFSIKVLLEAAVRQFDGRAITSEHVKQIANWAKEREEKEIPFIPARIVLQDFTGVPVVVDLAAMRDTVKLAGGDPKQINPLVPVDLVIDHSVMVDAFGTKDALDTNMNFEFERNEERYRFLRWAQTAFDNFRAVPPATGIVHQVNLEYLASVAATKVIDGETVVYGFPYHDDQRSRYRWLGRWRHRGGSRHVGSTALFRNT
jgi:aconitate hydratase